VGEAVIKETDTALRQAGMKETQILQEVEALVKNAHVLM
jgi:hypothetical protein